MRHITLVDKIALLCNYSLSLTVPIQPLIEQQFGVGIPSLRSLLYLLRKHMLVTLYSLSHINRRSTQPFRKIVVPLEAEVTANPNLYHIMTLQILFHGFHRKWRFCDFVCNLWLQKITQNGWYLPHTVCYIFLSLILNVSIWQYLSHHLLILHAYPASQQSCKVMLYIILSRNLKLFEA